MHERIGYVKWQTSNGNGSTNGESRAVGFLRTWGVRGSVSNGNGGSSRAVISNDAHKYHSHKCGCIACIDAWKDAQEHHADDCACIECWKLNKACRSRMTYRAARDQPIILKSNG